VTVLEANKSPVAQIETASAAASVSSFTLAAMLFDEIGELPKAPADRRYSDMLALAGFDALLTSLSDVPDGPDDLEECAQAVRDCTWIPPVVRAHLCKTLLGVSDGSVPLLLARAFVSAAARRMGLEVFMDTLRVAGSDGMNEIADAIGALADASNEASH
jgi:hypothetical protein